MIVRCLILSFLILSLCSCGALPSKTSTQVPSVQCPERAFQQPELPLPLPASPRPDVVAQEDIDAFGLWSIWILDGTAARKCLQALEKAGIIKVDK